MAVGASTIIVLRSLDEARGGGEVSMESKFAAKTVVGEEADDSI